MSSCSKNMSRRRTIMWKNLNLLNTENEQKCIELSLETRLNALKSKLNKYSMWQTDMLNIHKEFPLNFSEITWKPSLLGKLLQVSVFPVIILLKWLFILVSPIFYVISVGERYRERKKLKSKINDIENSLTSSDFATPEEKTLGQLWRYYGLDRDFSKGEQYRLLSDWIDLLYGPEIRKQFDFEQIGAEISKQQAKANEPYCRGEPDAPHFHFVDMTWSIAIEISKKLPPYKKYKK